MRALLYNKWNYCNYFYTSEWNRNITSNLSLMTDKEEFADYARLEEGRSTRTNKKN